MPDTERVKTTSMYFFRKTIQAIQKRYKLDKNNTGCVEKVQIVQKVQGKNKLSLENDSIMTREWFGSETEGAQCETEYIKLQEKRYGRRKNN